MIKARIKNKYVRFLVITVCCCIVYFLLGEPFRDFLKLSDTTEVRPVCVLPFIYGIVFGFPGTLGCAIGNVLADLRCGYSPVVFIPGFFIQIFYGYFPALLYKYLRRHEQNVFRLDRVNKILQYLAVIFVDSFFAGIMVWTLIHFVYGDPIFGLGFWNTVFNQLIFFIIIGIPLLCLYSIQYQRYCNSFDNGKKGNVISVSLNERFILFFIGFSIVISLMYAVSAYFVFRIYFASNPMKLWSYVYFSFGGCVFVCMIPTILFLSYMEKRVSTPLERMSSTVKSFGQEESIQLEIQKILMKSNKYVYFSNEIGNLARSYQYMANELEEYVNNLSRVTAEKEKTQTQLAIAADIQLGALPKHIDFEKIDLFAMMKPALEVGGDFYDFFKIDDTHIGIVIADVSGKGIPAALFMMAAKITLGKNLRYGMSPADALAKTNNELCESNPLDMFVTCFCGILDTETNIFSFANAGHNPPCISRNGKDFSIEKIKSGLVLGGMPGIKYRGEQVQLTSGDIVFVYTDGVPEAMSPSQEEFGNERLIQELNNAKSLPLSQMCDTMYNKIVTFNDTAPQFDDITMIVFTIK